MPDSKTASAVTGLEALASQAVSGHGHQAALSTLSAHLHDSHRGYEAGKRQTSDRFLRIEFTELASKRASMAQELDERLRASGVRPEHDGSTLGNVHRAVLDLQGKLFGRGRSSVLREIVRGEGVLENAYAEALSEELPPETRAVLKKQYRQVRATGDRYEAMLEEDEVAYNAPNTLLGRIDRLTKPLTSNPILSAIVVTAVSALTARLLRPRR
ncbi:PA2169 family four-helix-bundle protein [Roseomonas haemaphysalidis]|uniref:PA2169 family four-helix-bundle protein n=1 Tax=Roseomonas haemaphysalidis TaxID=2768162 RepID=A0ABS3KL61_9PROT|nr:PA2169 family four-helix-bundle protein [Roseomonas haemaphysalidis]MBO1078208.1 PA2169 family four-helix-bundle protein [Roseomonas haemaphysalidis]